MSRPRYHIRVLYKSGNSVEFHCDELRVVGDGEGGIQKATWTAADPKPLVIGIEHIEAIYQLNLND